MQSGYLGSPSESHRFAGGEINSQQAFNSALQKAYDQLARSERRFRELYDNAPDMYHTLDLEGNFIEFNPKHMEILGFSYAELDGAHVSRIIADNSMERLAQGWSQMRQTGRLENYEIDLKKKDGSTMTVEVHAMVFKGPDGQPKECRCIMRDITDRKRLEEQLCQSQKMESVGALAGGVAHDFNNLLTAIMGYTQMALKSLPEDAQAKEFMQLVMEASQRASNLSRQLLAFSRKQIIDPQEINLNCLIQDIQKMLGRLIGEHIELITEIETPLPIVKVDPGQVEQILMNLAVNARDAMPEGGKVTIKTANVKLSEREVSFYLGLEPGEYIKLSVTDTGVGIPDHVKARIFEPFFTTKECGKGTGLGLSMCYGIVKQNKGHITVESRAGQGATFNIYLPVAPEEVPTSDQKDKLASASGQGHETILLVEDDTLVRKLAGRMLRYRGYNVLEAADGLNALEVAERHTGKIDLLLTDVVMPNMSGKALSSQLKYQRPDIKVLYISGYTDDAIVSHGVLESEVEFLRKPFHATELAQKARQALDKRVAAEAVSLTA